MNLKTVQHFGDVVRGVFPKHADVDRRDQGGDLCLFVVWKLGTDPERPNKSSRSIEVRITREAMSDYTNSDENQRRVADALLRQYVQGKLASFEPEHDTPREVPLPGEVWVVSTDMINP
jgi:hypothetical protein